MTNNDGQQHTVEDVHIALLRGINVGGKNRLPMADLAAIFLGIGCRAVQTYIQSGNVVFRAEPSLAARVPALVAAAISADFGISSPVVTRTRAELVDVAHNNPYLAETAGTRALHVVFLLDEPEPSQIAALDPDRSPPDRFVVRGRELFLFCPNGVARTRLTNQYFDSRLKTTSTMRNWQTVLALLELAQEA
ncbi:MAG: DUF1697 domain-containing protein [Caldilineaceae bacterium]|nr:DUF1697 domain-containing protein [Caldilineaceae bacterium]